MACAIRFESQALRCGASSFTARFPFTLTLHVRVRSRSPCHPLSPPTISAPYLFPPDAGPCPPLMLNRTATAGARKGKFERTHLHHGPLLRDLSGPLLPVGGLRVEGGKEGGSGAGGGGGRAPRARARITTQEPQITCPSMLSEIPYVRLSLQGSLTTGP